MCNVRCMCEARDSVGEVRRWQEQVLRQSRRAVVVIVMVVYTVARYNVWPAWNAAPVWAQPRNMTRASGAIVLHSTCCIPRLAI